VIWDRLAAATGVGFVVIVAVSFLAVGELPLGPEASNDAIKIYFVQNRPGLLLQGYLNGIAAILLLWFVGSLRSALRGFEPGPGRLSAVAFGAGVAVVVISLIGNLMSTVLSFRQATEGIPVARFAFDLQLLTFTFIWFPASALVGAASMLSIRTGALPRAWGWLGGVIATYLLVAAATLFTDSGAFAPGGAVSLGGFGLFLGWVLVTSIMLIARTPSGESG
jgi:hypothetical protein